ncbi:MAG: DUF882 domain-containing protein [Pseudolabrys sp.]
MLRTGACLGLAGFFLFSTNNGLQTATAEGDTRTISFHHLHTDENITITYKRNGRYDDAALKKLDWFMRDWRREESTSMDPHLFDLLWETYREVGATDPIQVVCGFRSPATNAMLRARSTGVAQFSQHTQGHAMDFYIPGVPLEKVREIGPAHAARRRRLLSDLGLAFRASRYRLDPPLAAHDARPARQGLPRWPHRPCSRRRRATAGLRAGAGRGREPRRRSVQHLAGGRA